MINIKVIYWLEMALGSAALAIIACCPKESASTMLIAILISLLVIITDYWKEKSRFPEWMSAGVVSIGVVISAILIINF